jgi:hypothetical protein
MMTDDLKEIFSAGWLVVNKGDVVMRVADHETGKGIEPSQYFVGSLGKPLFGPDLTDYAEFRGMSLRMGGARIIQCISCREWFIRRHERRIYCSDACKQKAFRKTRRESAK